MLAAAALRLNGIQTQSLWFDEGWSAFAAAQPTLIAAFNADLTNPPLYYVLLNGFAGLAGDSEFALRLFSLFAGLITIPLSYQLGKRTAGDRAGWYAALLMSLSASLWWAAQEARMYTLLAVLILIAALAWQRLLTRPTRGAWIALAAAQILLLYAHNTGVVAALWLNAVTVMAWLTRRDMRRPHARAWFITQGVVGLIWLPYFVTRFLNLSAANAAVTAAPEIGLALAWDVWQSYMIAPYTLVQSHPHAAFAAVTAALMTLVLFVTGGRRAAWLWLHALILTGGLIAALIVLGNEFHGRYLVMIAPLVLTALGAGIARLPAALRLVALLAFAIPSIFSVTHGHNPLYAHDDARGMVQHYADSLTADDSVLAWSYADRYELAYYWDRLGVTARRVTLPEGADLDRVLPLLPAGGDVALNVWWTQRADYRGMMDCVLQHGALVPPETFTTYGMSSRLYRAPQPFTLQDMSIGAAFTDGAGTPLVRVESVGALPVLDAAAGRCVPIRLTLLAHTPRPLKAALIVQNDFGMEIARADAPFATADQRESGDVPAGTTLTAYPLLRLPYAAPAGSYRLFLRVYDEGEWVSGLTPPADQPSSGRDLLLGTWDAPAATWTPRHADAPFTVTVTPNERVTNGTRLMVEVVWDSPPQTVTLRSVDGTWTVEAPPTADGYPLREWRTLRVPPDAGSGDAVLILSDGTELARLRIDSTPLLTEAPPFDHALNAVFPGVGSLIGYTVSAPPYTRDNPPRLTLVWRAGDAPISVDYTVFAQLIGADGAVIAQSDQAPGGRAASSWRAGEIIVDQHTLAFNLEPRDGQLIVGLYDARTNTRVRLESGGDFVRLGE